MLGSHGVNKVSKLFRKVYTQKFLLLIHEFHLFDVKSDLAFFGYINIG